MIYYVEDDVNIRDMTVYALKQAGIEAEGFPDSDTFDVACVKRMPDAVLLDIMLPGVDGLGILANLRAHPATADIPVMMLTAKDTEFDTVVGLDSGADDYLAKPFGMMELISRCKALLRRAERGRKAEKGAVLSAGPIEMSVDEHSVRVDGQEIFLTLREFDLLEFLLENRGVAISRDRLLEQVWGWYASGESRTVDVHIQTLRQKLGEHAVLIETVRGVGYRLRA